MDGVLLEVSDISLYPFPHLIAQTTATHGHGPSLKSLSSKYVVHGPTTQQLQKLVRNASSWGDPQLSESEML